MPAVEAHQFNTTSSDVSFDIELAGPGGITAAARLDLRLVSGRLEFTCSIVSVRFKKSEMEALAGRP